MDNPDKWRTEKQFDDLTEMREAILKACHQRILDYPDGPFVVPISSMLRACGCSLDEFEKLDHAKQIQPSEVIPAKALD